MTKEQSQVLKIRPNAVAVLDRSDRHNWHVLIKDGERVITSQYVVGYHSKSDVSRATRIAWEHALRNLTRRQQAKE